MVPCLHWFAVLEALGVHWGDDFIFGIPDDRADDLEQLMHEVFKVKICERIVPGFLTAVEFLHRKVAWNVEGFSWTHDPKHTLASQRQEATRANEVERFCGTWFVSVGKGLRDGADGLDDKTEQKRNMQRKKQRDSCLAPRVLRSVCSNVCASVAARHPFSVGVFHIKKCQVRSGR